MRVLKAFACCFVLVSVPFTATGLGLGNIDLESALNEPFSATVPLESVGPADLNTLNVELASVDTFERYGLDRPEFLGSFKFDVAESNGEPVILVSSATPVSEPFVTFLIDVRWASGRLLREYTVLLDPPIYDAQPVQPNVAPAQVTEPAPAAAEPEPVAEAPASAVVTASPEVSATVSPESSLDVAPEASVADGPVAEEPVAEAPAAEESVAEAPTAAAPATEAESSAAAPAEQPAPDALSDTYTAQEGDTLWRIAQRAIGESGLSGSQMMMAIYRANPEAFLGNINALQAGSILRIPTLEEAGELSVTEALAEAESQNANWSDAPAATDGVADAGEAAAEPGSAAGQLELVVPGSEVATDGQGGSAAEQARISQLETDLQESQRLLEVRDAELQALQERVANLESAPEEPVADPAGGDVALEDEPLLTPVPAPDEALVESDAALAEEEILVEGMDEPLESPFADEAGIESEAPADVADVLEESVAVQPIDEPVPADVVDVAPAEESSLVGQLLSSYYVWGGAAALILLLLFVMRRRGATPEGDDISWADEIDTDESGAAAAVSEDLGATSSFEDSIVVDEIDTEEVDEAFATADVGEPDVESDVESVAESESLGATDTDLPPLTAEDTHSQLTDTGVGEVEPISLDALDVADAEAVQDEETETPLERTISTGAPLNLDQADPVAEAEFHMAYGLYDQAADLLTKALEGEPDNRGYRVKLIEVFFVWENKEGFLEQAKLLHESVADESDTDWSKVLILGKQLCPDAELFSGAATGSAGDMDLELSADAGETDIDFSLGGTEVETLDEAAVTDSSDEILDFDLGSLGDESEIEEPASLLDADDSALDFDLGSDAGDAESEVSAHDQTMRVDEALRAESEAPAQDDSLAVTMESPTLENPLVGQVGETVESPTLDIDLGDLGDLEEASEEPNSAVVGETDVEATAHVRSLEQPQAADPTSIDVDLSGLADLPSADEDADSTLSQLDNTGELLKPDDLNKTIAGLDLEDLADPSEPEVDIDSTLNQLDNTGELLTPDDLSKTIAGESTLESSLDEGGTAEQPALDIDLDGDTAEQPEVGDASVDLDLDDFSDTNVTDDATMTEVGTKLDLARAYIDMGDPDGARSILNEVIDEGADTQQQEARQLLEELGD